MPEEGKRENFLCSNKKPIRCPSLCINNNPSEDSQLDYLAGILVEIFLDQKNYERTKKCESKESSNLLPSIN